MSEVFVGRQPIYDRKLKIYGYELLFRSGGNPANAFQKVGADGATSTTIINSYLEIGLEKLVGKHLAFINLAEQFLLNQNIINALLNHEGDSGEALKCVLAYETSDFDNIRFKNLSNDEIFITNVEAVSWTNMVFDSS